jgi:hypothetical protein
MQNAPTANQERLDRVYDAIDTTALTIWNSLSPTAMLDAVLGATPTVKEQQNAHLRELTRAAQRMETAYAGLEREEKTAVQRMRNLVYDRRTDEARAVSLEIANIKAQKRNTRQVITTIKRAQGDVRQCNTTQTMTEVMNGVTRTMQACNQFTPARQLARTMQQYERATSEMHDKHEKLTDAVQGVGDAAENEQDADSVFESVLDEYCADLHDRLPAADRQQMARNARERQRQRVPAERVDQIAEAMLRQAASTAPRGAAPAAPATGAATPATSSSAAAAAAAAAASSSTAAAAAAAAAPAAPANDAAAADDMAELQRRLDALRDFSSSRAGEK